MPKCVTENFALTVPGDWNDRSMITWVAPPAPGRMVNPNVLISKGALEDGEGLDAFVNRQLQELMSKVKKFDLIARQETLFGGRPAVALEFSINPQGVPLQQRQVFFVSPSDPALVETVVATAAKADFPAFEATFAQIFNSVSWSR